MRNSETLSKQARNRENDSASHVTLINDVKCFLIVYKTIINLFYPVVSPFLE